MADVDYDALSETLSWGERFFATSYIELLFQPVNIVLLVFFFLTIYFGKIMFAVPFVLAELLNRKEAKQERVEAKKRRATQRDNKRKAKNQRALRRRTSSAASAAGGSRPVVAVEMTDVGLNVDDETKADAGAARPPSPTTPAAKPSTTNMGLLASAGGRAGDTLAADSEAPAGAGVSREQGFGWLDWELVKNDNAAVALAFTSFIVSITIVLSGVRTPAPVDDPFFQQIFDCVAWSAVGMVYLGLAAVFCNKLFLFGLSPKKGIHQENLASAIVKSGAYLGSAVVIRATLTGDNTNTGFGTAVLTSAAYFAVGQVLLLLSVVLIQCMTPYDDQKEIESGNTAAGVKLFGTLTSVGVLISHPILTSDSVAAFFTCYGVGMVLLTLLRFFLDKLIIPGNRSVDIEISEDQNWGVAAIEAAIVLAIAFALGSLVPDIECYNFT